MQELRSTTTAVYEPILLGDTCSAGVSPLEVRPPSSVLGLSRLLQPGMQRIPKCKITWDTISQGPTCNNELDSPTELCARRKLVT